MPQIEIPVGMYDEIMTTIKESPELGYENPEEFVREAIRKRFVDW